jgi:hypothetical protein
VLGIVPAVALAGAVALSSRSDMLQARCIFTIAPMVLLVVAHALDRLRARAPRRLALVAVTALLVTYAAVLPAQYGTPRSDARELAHDVAARAAPTDLVIIAPAYIASSFNRYYGPATEQIDFPVMGRVGAIDFDRTAQRFADPTALAEAERRLTAARATGRRVWLVVDHGSTICSGAQCESMAAEALRAASFGGVGFARASQLREYLGSLYGAPAACDDRTYTTGSAERLDVCLFTPR